MTVAGEAPLVDVSQAGVSEVVDQQRIVELPLAGPQRDRPEAKTSNPLTVRPGNIKKTYREHSTVLGHTVVLSSAAVNALRFTWLTGSNALNDRTILR